MPTLAVWIRRGKWRRIIGGALLAGVAALAGCSTARLGYAQAPLLLGWWLDGYADFDAQQRPQVRDAVGRFLAWHRAQALPRYAEAVALAARQVQQPALPEATVCGWADQAEGWVQEALAQALPDLARTAVTLQPAQLRHLADRLARREREFDGAQVQPSEAVRRREREAQWRERYESLYGPLQPAQRALLAEAAVALDPDAAGRLVQMRRRHQALLAALAAVAGAPPARAQAELGPLLQRLGRPMADGPPEWLARQRALREGHCALLSKVHALSTPAQREHAARWLQGWVDDLRAMAGEAPGAVAPLDVSRAP